MNEIKCPNCGTIFQIDESDYASIVKQVRDSEFNKEITLRDKEYQKDKENSIKLVQIELEKKYSDEINKKELTITNLQNELKLKDTNQELVLKNALSEKEKEINDLNNKLENSSNTYLLKEKSLKEQYEDKIKSKDEQIAYYKDFKARQSTKMIGESLEQHCNNEFNKLRPLFGNVYFEKDNDIKTGSKGDFIFREYDEDGVEIISIMF